MRKSQISLFMLFVVVLAIIGILVFFSVKLLKASNENELLFERSSIEKYVNSCLKKTSEDALKLLGKGGGYITQYDFVQINNAKVSLLLDGMNNVPAIIKMQNEMEIYIDNNLNACLNDFNDFTERGWSVEKDNPKSTAKINEKDVSFEMRMPLEVSYRGETLSYSTFYSRSEIRLKIIHDLVSKSVGVNEIIPSSVDRTLLSNYDMNVTVFPFENTLVYVVDDHKSQILKEDYRFIFGMRFKQ